MAVLTRASPFDTPASLVRKKLHPIDLSQNVACAWGRLFELFAREYIEWKHNTKVFGHTISLNLAKSHPLYGKVTCSPDGYFQALDKSLILLEIKCPFKRKIAVNKIPAVYRDQVQTGLALSGEFVTKGLFVDCCFRMCSLTQLGINLNHNPTHHHTSHRTKTPFPQAWGICILESKYKLKPSQMSLLNLGTTKSIDIFNQTLLSINSGKFDELRVRYNRVRVIWDPRTKAEELFVLKQAKGDFLQVSLAWQLVLPCCILRLEAARHNRNRGAQGLELLEVTRTCNNIVPPQLGSWEIKRSWRAGNHWKHHGGWHRSPRSLSQGPSVVNWRKAAQCIPWICILLLETGSTIFSQPSSTNFSGKARSWSMPCYSIKPEWRMCVSLSRHMIIGCISGKHFPEFDLHCRKCGGFISPEFDRGRHMGCCKFHLEPK